MAGLVKVSFISLALILSADISNAQDLATPPDLPSLEMDNAALSPIENASSAKTPAPPPKPASVKRWMQSGNLFNVVTRPGSTEWRVNGKIVLEDQPAFFGLLGSRLDGKPNVLSLGKKGRDGITTWQWISKDGIPVLAYDLDKNGECDRWDFDLNKDDEYDDGYFESLPASAGIPSPPEEN